MERRHLLAAFGGVGLAALASGDAAAAGHRGRHGGHRLAEAFAAALSAHDMAAFAALFAEDYEQHQPIAAAAGLPGGLTAKQGVVRYFTARVTAFPDLVVTAEPVVAHGEWVAANFVYSGTHQGEYFGVAATGRHVTFNSTDILRVRKGLFAAHWGAADIAGLLKQLQG